MAHVQLADGDAHQLQQQLWQQDRIEVPIVSWEGHRFVRVSCHLYNSRSHIDQLVAALSRSPKVL
jgi:isopenicillin-N epimerase